MTVPVFPNTYKGLRWVFASELLVFVLGILTLSLSNLSFLAVFHELTAVAISILLVSSIFFFIGVRFVSLDGVENKLAMLIELVRIVLYAVSIITLMLKCSEAITEMSQICAELCRVFDICILLNSIAYVAYSLADRIVARLTCFYCVGIFVVTYSALALIRTTTILVTESAVLEGINLAFTLLHIFPNLVMMFVLIKSMRMLRASRGTSTQC
jgi:hypothetical protein